MATVTSWLKFVAADGAGGCYNCGVWIQLPPESECIRYMLRCYVLLSVTRLYHHRTYCL